MVAESQSERFFYSPTRELFHQAKYDKNLTTIAFKAFDSAGRYVNGLQPQHISIVENGIPVSNFILKGETTRNDYDVDIVFTIDITASMDEEIGAIKSAVRDFVGKLASHNVKARLCAVTFKDEIVDKCTRFVNDNPATPQNENLDWFLDFLTRLDPGGGGAPKENSLGGVVEAAQKTPWNPNHQRVVIVFTDIGFWVQPIDRNEPEARTAPTFPGTLEALRNSKVMAFAVTPNIDGFNDNYFQYPSITKDSGGTWFNLRKLQNGEISMDQIFDKITQSLITNYVAEYNVEDNPGLDPHLKLSDRNINVSPAASSPAARIVASGVQSNWPEGQPLYHTRFSLKPGVKRDTLTVSVDGLPTSSGWQLIGHDLVFATPPAPAAEILAVYEVGPLRDNIQIQTITLNHRAPVTQTRLELNGSPAGPGDFKVTELPTGEVLIDLRDPAFLESDPYNIRGLGYLDVLIRYLRP